ncbi:HAD family hydrolase [Notoacmeibacter marinus]|uniref:HAD family hydrolase n=1 Tax=Notoacmeibacter marinus TaxID=1876515 RepID=A0A231V0T4_9HYPH|nr:HAD-IB family hydrolase [Notoacmeibacter marinus]OXT01651.1 HAD family hydrolase [Notoacmeibacter marinus]
MNRSSRRFAFFDVDDTLIHIKSMFDFFRFWTLDWLEDPDRLALFEADFAWRRRAGQPREDLNRAYYRYFKNLEPDRLTEAGQAWAARWLAAPDRLFVASAVSELRRLQGEGVEAVFVSGSFDAVLQPLADQLDVTHSLATTLLIGHDGRFSGEIGEPQTIGAGKADAVRAFLAHHEADASLCYAFGDDMSDLPMLRSVGTPVVVGSDSPLARHATSQSWKTLSAA